MVTKLSYGLSRVRNSLLSSLKSLTSPQVKFGSTYDSNYLHSSPYTDAPPPMFTVHHFVWTNIKNVKRKTAVQCGLTGRRYTYWEMKEFSRRFASALTKIGIRKGDVLAIISDNSPEYPIAVLGAMCTGVSMSPVSPQLTVSELTKMFLVTNVMGVITSEGYLPKVLEVKTMLKAQIRKVILMGGNESGCYNFEDMLEDDCLTYPRNVTFKPKDDIGLIMYSSGTTGVPKAVMLSHHNLVSNIAQQNHRKCRFLTRGSESFQEVLMCMLPLYHVWPLVSVVLAGFSLGAKIVTLRGYDAKSFANAAKEYQPTCVHIVPYLMNKMSRDPNFDEDSFKSVTRLIVAAAPLGDTVRSNFLKRISNKDIKIFSEYGMTEVGPISLRATVQDSTPPKSVGVCVPSTKARVVDTETHKNLGPNTKGVLLVQGPQIMKGYIKNQKATKQILTDDNWILTGDLAKYDEQGYFYIVGRMKEIIKVKDEQVSPVQIEDTIRRHPKVKDVAVVGVPDQEFGEAPKAFVVKEDDSLTEDEVQEFVKDKLAPFKHLKGGVEFLNKIPRTATGKIKRTQLKIEP